MKARYTIPGTYSPWLCAALFIALVFTACEDPQDTPDILAPLHVHEWIWTTEHQPSVSTPGREIATCSKNPEHHTDRILAATQDLSYSTSNSRYTVSKGSAFISGTIVIPATNGSDQIVGIADNAFSGCVDLTSIYIPPTVTHIGANAFSGCTNLTSVFIYPAVTNIGEDAFSNCTKLASITVANDNTSFASAGGILYNAAKSELIRAPGGITGNVTIPEGVQTIHANAFSGCARLAGVTINTGNFQPVSTIGANAFSGCTSLTTMFIPSGISLVSDAMFSGCTRLISVEFKGSLQSIGANAFSGCTSLTSIKMQSLGIIGANAFSGCTSLGSINFLSSVTTIGNNAFSGSGLLSVTIPASVTSIGTGAFSNCARLLRIEVNASNQNYANHLRSGTSLYDGILYNKTGTTLIQAPGGISGTVTIFNDVTEIATLAFSGCTKPSSITIPSSVTTVGEGAFSNWLSGQTIYIDKYGSKSAADSGWGANWSQNCNAKIRYWNTNTYTDA